MSLYFKDGRVKAEIALARGKREFDKRQALREEQDKREEISLYRNGDFTDLCAGPHVGRTGNCKAFKVTLPYFTLTAGFYLTFAVQT